MRPQTVIPSSRLRKFVRDLVHAAGCNDENADAVTEVFIEAELRGVGVQGIDYLPFFLKNLVAGNINGAAHPQVLSNSAACLTIDGQRAPGQRAMLMASQLLAAHTREHGISAAAISNSTDAFMIGYYAGRLAEAGLVGMAFTTGAALVHAHGGIDRVLGTNPLAIAFPRQCAMPIIVDIATSAVSNARVRQAAYHQERLGPGNGLDADGLPTDHPSRIQAGAISPLGGHKGFALSLCVALLAGPLTGSLTGPDLHGWIAGTSAPPLGHLLIGLDPKRFAKPGKFESMAARYLQQIKDSRTSPGISGVRIPGERAYAERNRRLRDGIPVLDTTLELVKEQAKRFGVEFL